MKLSDDFGQEIDFEIPKTKTSIAVNCSGGADSSILLFMVCEYIKSNQLDTKVSVLTCGNDNKNRWNVRKAADVINYTIDKLKWNQIDTHYAYYRDFQDVKYFHEFERKLFEDKRVDMIVSGLTANPKVEAIVENAKGEMINLAKTALDVRNSENKPTMQIDANGNEFYSPFINVDKRFIAAMYNKYGVLDMLDLTRSCEATPQPPGMVHSVDYDPAFEQQPCGICWWCLERKWAFGRL
jgi:7-cyano-7-deazaguanine synthase in queuosine biosynthesis